MFFTNLFSVLVSFNKDGRTLIDHARLEAQNHRFTFDEVS